MISSGTLPFVPGDPTPPLRAPLMAGQHHQVGWLELSTHAGQLQARVTSDFGIVGVQLQAAAKLRDIPQTKKGNPIPGQFALDVVPSDPAADWTVNIPLSPLGIDPGDTVFVAAHVTLDVGPDQPELGAWAAGLPFPGANWATYAAGVLNRDPVAAFTVSAQQGSLQVSLDASASADPDGQSLTYAWTFGDGSNGAGGPAMQHQYSTGGEYAVTLTVSDGMGGTGTVQHQVRVNRRPVAAFAVTQGDTPLTGKFDASASSDPDGDQLSYAWTFGDGANGTGGPVAEHVYAAGGQYAVKLVVSDAFGAKDSVEHIATFNRPPTAAFTASAGGNTMAFSFDGSASSDPDGDALTYAWAFGDGATATSVTASHTYTTPGLYDVRLTVTDPHGALGDVTHQVEARAPAGPDLVLQSCTVTPATAATIADEVDFSLTLANQGTADAVFPGGYAFAIEMQNAGGSYSPDNLGGVTVAAGSTRQITVRWTPFSHTEGTYSPTVKIDKDNRVIETDETNNTYACPTVTLGPQSTGADLVITNVALSTSPITTATSFTFQVTVQNQGNGSAAISYPSLIVSSLQSYYVYPSQFTPWTLAPGASQTFTAQPNWGYISVGTFDWVFTVDPGNMVHELDETNNSFTLHVTVSEPPPPSGAAPDLVLRSCDVTPASGATIADEVDFSLTLANQGTADAVFPNGYAFAIEMQNAGGSYSPDNLGGVTLAAGTTRQITVRWVPFSHVEGTYSPTVLIDKDNRVIESDETNNTYACPTVTLGPQSTGADLVITDVTLSTSPITTATNFTFQITVQNQGNGSAVISYPALIVSSLQSYYVYPSQFTPWTLAAGASQTFTVLPNWGYIQPGTHDWVFTVDPGNMVHELDETNNTFTLHVTVLDASGGGQP